MAAPIGNKFSPGRPKGIPNKLNADVKAMLAEALENAGGAAYFAEQAEKNPSAFMSLIGKAFVTETTKTTVSGDPDNPVKNEFIIRVVRDRNTGEA